MPHATRQSPPDAATKALFSPKTFRYYGPGDQVPNKYLTLDDQALKRSNWGYYEFTPETSIPFPGYKEYKTSRLRDVEINNYGQTDLMRRLRDENAKDGLYYSQVVETVLEAKCADTDNPVIFVFFSCAPYDGENKSKVAGIKADQNAAARRRAVGPNSLAEDTLTLWTNHKKRWKALRTYTYGEVLKLYKAAIDEKSDEVLTEFFVKVNESQYEPFGTWMDKYLEENPQYFKELTDLRGGRRAVRKTRKAAY